MSSKTNGMTSENLLHYEIVAYDNNGKLIFNINGKKIVMPYYFTSNPKQRKIQHQYLEEFTKNQFLPIKLGIWNGTIKGQTHLISGNIIEDRGFIEYIDIQKDAHGWKKLKQSSVNFYPPPLLERTSEAFLRLIDIEIFKKDCRQSPYCFWSKDPPKSFFRGSPTFQKILDAYP